METHYENFYRPGFLCSGSGDGRFREFHIKDKYKTVGEALKLFKDDDDEPSE